MSQPLHAARFDRLIGVLERYIARDTVAAMLKTVLAEREIVAEKMTVDDLFAVVEEVMIGLRLFCNPTRLPDLMLDLAELCDQEAQSSDGPPSQTPISLREFKFH